MFRLKIFVRVQTPFHLGYGFPKENWNFKWRLPLSVGPGGSCPLLESSTLRRKHPFCPRSFWVRARIHPNSNNSVILTSLASLWSLSASTFSKFSFVWVTRLTGFPILQNVSSIFDEQRRGKKTFNIKWEPRNIWKIQLNKNFLIETR